jgi:LacI family transcriptional regulator
MEARLSDRVTIAQVAEEAGVSAMTVSNVLNGRPGASEETRRRVLGAAERLGYQPNLSARSLKGGRTGLIGVMTLDLTGQYGLEIVRGIADELASDEREMLISATYQDGVRERERVEFLARGLVDGVLMVAPVLEDDSMQSLRRKHLPCVVIDPRRLDVSLPRVTVDNYGGMRQGTQHLLDLGHRRIAYLRGNSDLESSAVRYQGFHDALRLAGVDVDESMVAESDFSYAQSFRIASALIAEHRPTALLAGADLIALGAADAARAFGLRVPDEFSVVGFDDLPQAAQTFPALTTVRQPLHEMGKLAARMLLSLIDGRPLLMQNMQMPTELIVRGTTAPPPDGTPKPGGGGEHAGVPGDRDAR